MAATNSWCGVIECDLEVNQQYLKKVNRGKVKVTIQRAPCAMSTKRCISSGPVATVVLVAGREVMGAKVQASLSN